jgi:hypothetical protein
MPAIAKDEAVVRLTTAIQAAPADEMVEIYNEMFPRKAVPKEAAAADVAPLLAKVNEHIRQGLEIEEIVDLWRVVFPKSRRLHFDEETESIRYNDDSERFWYTE